MAVRPACSRWKARVTIYIKFVNDQVAEAEEIQSVAAGRAMLELFEEKWEKNSDAYAKLEDEHPDLEDSEEDEPGVPDIYQERKDQLERAVTAYNRGYKAIARRIAAMKLAAEVPVQAGPTSAQRAATMTSKRARVYREIRKRVEQLGADILAQEATGNLALSACFDEERMEIRKLSHQLEEVTDAIQEIDLEAYEAAQAEHAEQDREIAQVLGGGCTCALHQVMQREGPGHGRRGAP